MKKLKSWAVVLLLGLLGAGQSAFANIEYRYFYDELDRLTKAADSTGVVLEYVYDEVGNILEVKRTENSGLSILDVQPHAAQAGEQVTLEGIGFSTVANENTVTFDGIAANVLTATSSQLAVEVPAGVTAGVIVVTVAGNTATVSGNFQLQALPIVNSLSTSFVLSGQSIPALVVTGSNLTGSTFSFSPAFVPPSVTITSATVAPDGLSAALAVNVGAAAVGSFVLQASNTAGQSNGFSSDVNTLVVLGSATDDSDGDGLTNEEEIAQGTNPTKGDTDGDGLPDKYEIDNRLDPTNAADALLDSDNDGIDNLTEYEQGTDPSNSDITPPGVDQIAPVDTEIDFPTNGKMVVRFTEPLQPESILPGSVRLFQGGLLLAGQVDLSSDQLSITFDPSDSLSAFTTYTVQVQGVRDVAGNPITNVFESTFTTGEFIDDVPPEVVSFSIPSSAQDVPVNAPITVLFNEPMNPATLDDTTFILRDNTVFQNIAGIIQVNPDGTTVSFVPQQPLPVGRSMTAILNTSITDTSGNPLGGGRSSSFETAFDEDNAAPSVIGVTPPDGAVDVPTNANIMVEFNEAIDLINVIGSITVQADGVDVPGSMAVTNASRRVTFTPAAELDPNAVITVTATTNISDLAGNALGATVTSEFTTGQAVDLQRSTVLTLTPFQGETNVPTNTLLQVEVDERINPLTVTASSFTLRINTTFQNVPGTHNVSADGKTLTFVPDVPLETDRSYTLTVNSNVKDLANNALSGRSTTFSTGASISTGTGPLTVTDINVQDGITEVPINTSIVIELSEAINAIDMPADAIVLATGSTPVVGTLALSSNREQLTFTSTNNLTPASLYTVDVSGLASVNGGTLTPFSSSFTTSASTTADTTRPTLVSVVPANSALDVSSNAVVMLQFSERVNPLTVTTSSFYVEQITDVTARISGAITVATDGLSATFTPDQPLIAGNQYRARALTGIQDLAGNTYGSTSVPTTFTVSSGAGGVVDTTLPIVEMVTPADGSIDVHRDTKVVLTFSESLDPSTVNSSNMSLFVNGNAFSASITRSADNRTVTLNRSLPLDSDVAVIVTSAVRDLAGNAIAGFSSTFTTETAFDVSRPSVVTQRPGNGARNIPIDQSVVLFVNEVMQASTVPGALRISQNGVLVNGNVTVTPDGRGIEFTPDTSWVNNALIQVFMDETTQDLSGNALRSYKGSFTVVADSTATTPRLVSTNLTIPVGELPSNPVIELEYNVPLDPATVNDTTIVLHESASGNPIVASTVGLIDGRIIKVVPNEPLTAATAYFVDIFNGIQDLDGQTWTSNTPTTLISRQSFTTGDVVDNTAPVVIAVSPTDGSTDVAPNTNIRVRFNERINPLTISADSILVTDGNTVVVPMTISFTGNNSEILLAPHAPLVASTIYDLTITGVEDNAGNVVVTNATQFTTGSEIDTITPKTIVTTPFSGATDVPVNSPVVLVIDEPIDPISINDVSFNVRDNTTFQNLAGTRNVSTDGRIISFVPDVPFGVSRSHSVITSSLVVDLAGNRLAGNLSFTTAFDEDTTPPQVQSISPPDGLGTVATNTHIMIQFDEPIQGLSTDQVILSAGGVATEVVPVWSNGNRLLELISPLPLAANTAYTVTINAGLKDTAGNALGATVTSEFTTGQAVDLQRPIVMATTPFQGETNVPTNTLLQVEVDERINPLTVTASSFTLRINTTFQNVPGTHNVSADGKTLTFVPDVPLETDRSYTLTVNSNVRDLANNALSGSNATFTTGN